MTLFYFSYLLNTPSQNNSTMFIVNGSLNFNIGIYGDITQPIMSPNPQTPKTTAMDTIQNLYGP